LIPVGGSYCYSSKSFEIRFESNLGFSKETALRPISGSRVTRRIGSSTLAGFTFFIRQLSPSATSRPYNVV